MKMLRRMDWGRTDGPAIAVFRWPDGSIRCVYCWLRCNEFGGYTVGSSNLVLRWWIVPGTLDLT